MYGLLTTGKRLAASAALLMAIVVLAQTHGFWPFRVPDLWREVSRSIAVFCGAVFLLSWFRRHADVDSPRSRLFSDASYTIYLLHGPFLIGYAMLLVPVNLPGPVKFVILIAAVLASTLALHTWVTRWPILAIARWPRSDLAVQWKGLAAAPCAAVCTSTVGVPAPDVAICGFGAGLPQPDIPPNMYSRMRSTNESSSALPACPRLKRVCAFWLTCAPNAAPILEFGIHHGV